ncbi:MAG TPA: TIGR03085 family metal-binding protein [Microlunatus sp.]|nr:TIGR03085 family metal-binding protein [Microlunatus sp.]
MTFAKSERAALCDLFDAQGPAAPTLCEGWSTHDLAAHLWIRETDPIGASGLVAKPLSGLLDRRMAEVKQRWDFAELVDRIRNGPARFSVFALPGVDEPANTTEFFVHHEDVRRAGAEPLPPRELSTDVEDWMWKRLKLLGRAFFRRAQVGVVLERAGTEGQYEPEAIRAVSGATIVTVIGKPSELMFYANGRGSAADVRLVGEQDALDLLHSADLTI